MQSSGGLNHYRPGTIVRRPPFLTRKRFQAMSSKAITIRATPQTPDQSDADISIRPTVLIAILGSGFRR